MPHMEKAERVQRAPFYEARRRAVRRWRAERMAEKCDEIREGAKEEAARAVRAHTRAFNPIKGLLAWVAREA